MHIDTLINQLQLSTFSVVYYHLKVYTPAVHQIHLPFAIFLLLSSIKKLIEIAWEHLL